MRDARSFDEILRDTQSRTGSHASARAGRSADAHRYSSDAGSSFANAFLSGVDSKSWARSASAGVDIATNRGHARAYLRAQAGARSAAGENSRTRSAGAGAQSATTNARSAAGAPKSPSPHITVTSLTAAQRLAFAEIVRLGARFASPHQFTLQELRAEWRRLARATHPDTAARTVHGAPVSGERFDQIRRAYQSLRAAQPAPLF